MRIAIIGAGFSGLALAYYLKKNGNEVTIYDQNGIGGGASGVAAGLLHPYVGFDAKKSWRAEEGMAATKELLDVASQFLGIPVYVQNGIERIPVNERQEEAFAIALKKYEDLEKTELGILIPSGISVHCKRYLEGLALAVGGEVHRQKIEDLRALAHYDRVIVAAGAGTAKLTGETLHPMKGQILQFRAKGPSRPIIKKKYLVSEGETVWIGATYERSFSSEEPNVAVAKKEILPFFPEYAGKELLQCQAGIRVFTPDKRPLVQANVLSGLGSKGLLYHALFAKEIANP